MIEVRRTEAFVAWLDGLRDECAKARIVSRLQELRIDYGPGYRLYYVQRDKVLVILLCGGDKSTQGRDIKMAQKLAAIL